MVSDGVLEIESAVLGEGDGRVGSGLDSTRATVLTKAL